MDDQIIEDTMLLLMHSVKAGLKVEAADATLVLDLREKNKSNPLTPSEEASIWVTYAKLSSSARPVTVESLRAISEPTSVFGHTMASSAARRTIRFYSYYAILAFITLVSLQIYWLIGDGLTQAIVKSRADLNGYVAQLYALQNPGTNLAAASATNTSITVRPGTSSSPSAGTIPARDDRELLSQNISRTLAILVGYYQALWRWSAFWNPLVTSGQKFDATSYAVTIKQNVASQDSSQPETHPVASGETRLTGINADGEYIFSQMEVEAAFALQALQKFVLPFLYGLLGTLMYVLRNLAATVFRNRAQERRKGRG